MIRTSLVIGLFFSTWAFVSAAVAAPLDQPVLARVGQPRAVSPMNQDIAVTPQCQILELNEGYHEDAMVKKVCCSNTGKMALAPLIQEMTGGMTLRVTPLDGKSEELYNTGCTSDLSTLKVTLQLRVTYIP